MFSRSSPDEPVRTAAHPHATRTPNASPEEAAESFPASAPPARCARSRITGKLQHRTDLRLAHQLPHPRPAPPSTAASDDRPPRSAAAKSHSAPPPARQRFIAPCASGIRASKLTHNVFSPAVIMRVTVGSDSRFSKTNSKPNRLPRQVQLLHRHLHHRRQNSLLNIRQLPRRPRSPHSAQQNIHNRRGQRQLKLQQSHRAQTAPVESNRYNSAKRAAPETR